MTRISKLEEKTKFKTTIVKFYNREYTHKNTHNIQNYQTDDTSFQRNKLN